MIPAGGTVQVSGCGFESGSEVTIRTRRASDPQPAGPPILANGRDGAADLQADPSGCISGTRDIRDKPKAGDYLIEATGKDPNGSVYQLVSQPVTVTVIDAPGVAIDAQPTASARSDQASLTRFLAPLSLILLGIIFTSGLRRRRRRSE